MVVEDLIQEFDKYMSDKISRETKAALRILKEQGVQLGRPRNIPEGIVKRIHTMRSNGASLRTIADTFNREGIPTARHGKQWYASTIKAVLSYE